MKNVEGFENFLNFIRIKEGKICIEEETEKDWMESSEVMNFLGKKRQIDLNS